MPTIRINGTEVFYEEHGTGHQTVFLAHGLALSGRMFHHQVLALRHRFRCITMDFRGQGRSAVATRGYDMDTLTRDVSALLRKLNAGPCHYVGLSMGGFVGLRLALQHPKAVRSLTLINTSAEKEALGKRLRYGLMIAMTRHFGVRAVARSAMQVLFGPEFLTDPDRAEERRRWRSELLNNNRIGIARATRGVIQRDAVIDRLAHIQTRTLIIAGDEDRAVPLVDARRMHELIAGSKLIVIPNTGHNCCLEAPQEVTEHMLDLFDSVT